MEQRLLLSRALAAAPFAWGDPGRRTGFTFIFMCMCTCTQRHTVSRQPTSRTVTQFRLIHVSQQKSGKGECHDHPGGPNHAAGRAAVRAALGRDGGPSTSLLSWDLHLVRSGGNKKRTPTITLAESRDAYYSFEHVHVLQKTFTPPAHQGSLIPVHLHTMLQGLHVVRPRSPNVHEKRPFSAAPHGGVVRRASVQKKGMGP